MKKGKEKWDYFEFYRKACWSSILQPSIGIVSSLILFFFLKQDSLLTSRLIRISSNAGLNRGMIRDEQSKDDSVSIRKFD